MGGESDGAGVADVEAIAPASAMSPEVNDAIPRPKNMKPTRGSAITSKRLVRRSMEAVDFLVVMRYREDTLASKPTGSTSQSEDSIDDDSTADSDKPLLDCQCPDAVPDYTRYIRAQPTTEIVALLTILTTTRAPCEFGRAWFRNGLFR